MATQITNHKCPACTGPLHFVGESGKLECDYCGSSYEVAEIEALYSEKEEKAKEAFKEAGEDEKEDSYEDIGEYTLSSEDGEGNGDWNAERMKAYNCPSCGAELICDDTTAATSCPYCDNPTVIPGQFDGSIKPDYIIPFKLDKKAAVEALKNFYKGKFLLPKVFSDANHIDEIKGIYVPFWMFSAETEGNIVFNATKTHVYRSGDYEVTKTNHYKVTRSGRAFFEKLPTDASSKMADDYMDSLEPFNYGELKPFSTAYMPGYLADRYDVSVEECSPRADLRFRNSLTDLLRDDVKGYATVTTSSKNIKLTRGEVKYAMLPVWVLNTHWNDNKYTFMMNGQTGKFVGELPIDKKKYNILRLGVALASTLILGFAGVGGMIASLIL
ncbi:MAG: hypothetical protein E7265_02595 [Lachnospiraceae bacterium]|nr:hypothetical protein [Lachnospiraceae bacterium]